MGQTKCETHVQDVTLKNAEMHDPSTMHGTVITHFCVARRQGVKNNIKIYIKTVPTCFGAVTPSSGSALFVLAKVTVVNLLNAKLNPSCKSQLAEFF